MEKRIFANKISFYDGDKELISLKFVGADFTIYVNTKEVIEINNDNEIYECLNEIFKMQYDFGYNRLNDIKTNSLLVWHSDCYYNPNDIISVSSLSCLHIKLEDGIYKLWCDKEINKLLNLDIEEFCIGFSPCGNGRYARNIKTGSTLQDDFVIKLYQRLFLESLKEKTITRKIKK